VTVDGRNGGVRQQSGSPVLRGGRTRPRDFKTFVSHNPAGGKVGISQAAWAFGPPIVILILRIRRRAEQDMTARELFKCLYELRSGLPLMEAI
jgi:hypothetical protein